LLADRAAPDPGPPADGQRLQKAGVGTDGASLLEFFRRRTVRADPRQIRDLIGRLGSRSFHDRSRASAALAALGAAAVPQLRRALAGAGPLRRACAAAALCRSGVKERPAALAGLLKDPDARVRLYAGLALAEAGERRAVPALIGLFTDLPRNKLWRVEDALYR